jgi:transcriptional regulator with XRE-family HTH domain
MTSGRAGDRLREARQNAGFKSARSAAIKFGWTPSTYASHENGQTPVPVGEAKIYAQAFKSSWAWILTGEKNGRVTAETETEESVPARATLPLPEGTITIEMPAQLSDRSRELLLSWITVLADLSRRIRD